MTAASSVALPSPGATVGGKYVLERELGRGGMGAVFAARHTRMGNAVAIKVMLADAANTEAFTRFMNEARAASNIQSEHVVRVTDVDEEHGYAFMVLELLDGEDLAQVLDREKRLPPHVAVSYAMQALSGVAQAHAHGIVHRDLKPSNLFLTKRSDGSRVIKVLDFGISKQGASALAQKPANLTSTKAMLGSPLYMSPEQLRSSKTVDHRADIWAMGVILYELMSGTLPFTGESLGELFAAILETETVPLHQRVTDGSIPPGLSMIVARCLSRRPEDRFQTANELVSALSQFASTGSGGFQAHATAAMTAGMSYHAVPPGAAVTPGTLGMGHRPMGMGNTPMPHGMGQNTPMPQGMGNTPMPHGMANTPMPNAMPNAAYGTAGMRGPPGAANTGSGVVKATAPLGSQTPQPHDQSMRLSANTVPKSRVGIFLGAAAFFAVVGIALIVVFMIKKPADPIGTTGNAPSGTPSADPIPPPSAVALPSATATASASATVAATASTPPTATTAAVATAATVAGNPKRPPPPPVKIDTPPPPTAKTTATTPTAKPPTDIGATR